MGIATADKASGSRDLWVYCPELLPFLSGSISAKEVSNDLKTNTREGTRTSSIKTTNNILCQYRDETTNRAFPPDVRKGEQVVVYCYGDSNQFYWKSAGRNDNSRRTEDYRMAISGSLANNPDQTDDNTYFFEMCTRSKHAIKISTSNADGEAHRYVLNIDADSSTVFLGDDYGNQIYIDSDKPRVCMKNQKNSLLDLNDENIVMACKKDISILSDSGDIAIVAKRGKMTIKSETSTDVKCNSGNINVDAATMMMLKAGATMTLQSGSTMLLSSGGGLNMTFVGSGSCTSPGGTMTMSMTRLNINKS